MAYLVSRTDDSMLSVSEMVMGAMRGCHSEQWAVPAPQPHSQSHSHSHSLSEFHFHPDCQFHAAPLQPADQPPCTGLQQHQQQQQQRQQQEQQQRHHQFPPHHSHHRQRLSQQQLLGWESLPSRNSHGPGSHGPGQQVAARSRVAEDVTGVLVNPTRSLSTVEATVGACTAKDQPHSGPSQPLICNQAHLRPGCTQPAGVDPAGESGGQESGELCSEPGPGEDTAMQLAWVPSCRQSRQRLQPRSQGQECPQVMTAWCDEASLPELLHSPGTPSSMQGEQPGGPSHGSRIGRRAKEYLSGEPRQKEEQEEEEGEEKSGEPTDLASCALQGDMMDQDHACVQQTVVDSEGTVTAQVTVSPGRILAQEYAVEGVLGEGRFGLVWRFTHLATRVSWACKQISTGEQAGEQEMRNELRGLALLQGHPNILHLHRVFQGSASVFVLTELCSGGDLYEHLSLRYPMGESEARGLFLQLTEAVRFCHKRGVLHRDIKPENALLQHCSVTGHLTLKLADFGLSTVLREGETVQGWVGSWPYEAPEVVAQRPYSFPADVFSLGVVLFGLISGAWPRFSEQKVFLPEKEFAHHEWEHVSKEGKGLVARMMSLDPRLRPTAQDILKDPWVTLNLEDAPASGPSDRRDFGDGPLMLHPWNR